MGRDTIAEIITSIRNADMDRKRVVRIASTNITENIVKILLREGFIENVRKHRESNKYFLVSTLRHRRNRKRPYRNILNLKRKMLFCIIHAENIDCVVNLICSTSVILNYK